jgi:hypothetical protein
MEDTHRPAAPFAATTASPLHIQEDTQEDIHVSHQCRVASPLRLFTIRIQSCTYHIRFAFTSAFPVHNGLITIPLQKQKDVHAQAAIMVAESRLLRTHRAAVIFPFYCSINPFEHLFNQWHIL